MNKQKNKLNYYETVLYQNLHRLDINAKVEENIEEIAGDESLDILNLYNLGELTEENLNIFGKEIFDSFQEELSPLLCYESEWFKKHPEQEKTYKELQSKLGIIYEYATSCIRKANLPKLIIAILKRDNPHPEAVPLAIRKPHKELRNILQKCLQEIGNNYSDEKQIKGYAKTLTDDLIHRTLGEFLQTKTRDIVEQFIQDLF